MVDKVKRLHFDCHPHLSLLFLNESGLSVLSLVFFIAHLILEFGINTRVDNFSDRLLIDSCTVF